MNDEYNLNKLIMRGRHLTDKTSGSRLVFTNLIQLKLSLLLFYRRQLHVKRKSNILDKIK